MTRRRKFTIVGAGNVGTSTAQSVAAKELGDVVIVDIVEGLPKGKAIDLWEMSPLGGFDVRVSGSTGYESTEGSDLAIITSGIARKPGMSREDLIDMNRKIVEYVVSELVRTSPQCTLVMVTNPLDTMTYLALRKSGFPKTRVIGQAGVLDSSRFRTFIADALSVSVEDTQALVLGGHGDEMVPLPRYCTVSGVPIAQLIPCDQIQKIVERTIHAGGNIVRLLKTGSAFISPGAAVAEMAEAILRDKKRVMPCSVYLDGEYGLKDICFGVPVKLGAGGVEKIVGVELTEEEKRLVRRSAGLVRKSISSLTI